MNEKYVIRCYPTSSGSYLYSSMRYKMEPYIWTRLMDAQVMCDLLNDQFDSKVEVWHGEE